MRVAQKADFTFFQKNWFTDDPLFYALFSFCCRGDLLFFSYDIHRLLF